MPKAPLPLLNLAFTLDRLRELGLKQWWVADQIGVDRKTVGRWLAGRVKRVAPENLAALARVLSCKPEELALKDEADGFASRSEQEEAARLIAAEKLLETLHPSHQWKLLESLIKATLQPELPLPVLGQLYNQLSIAAWRQSVLDRAEQYAAKALAVAKQCKSKAIEVEAKHNLATLASFRGRLAASLFMYEEVIEMARFLDDDLARAKALSNIACVYQDYGDLHASVSYQQAAILAFSELERPVNQAIAWISLSDAVLEKGEATRAEEAARTADELAVGADFKRGIGDARLALAHALAAQGRVDEATAALIDALARHEALGIDEGMQDYVAAKVARVAGDLDEAERRVERGLAGIARSFPVMLAKLQMERRALALARGDKETAAAALAEARALYEEMGAKARLSALPGS